MDTAWIAVLSAIAGGVITGGTALLTQLIQARSELVRERARLAIEAAIADHRVAFEIAKMHGAFMPPLSVYIHYNARILEMLHEGTLKPESLRRLDQEQDAINAVIKEGSKRPPPAAAGSN